MFEFKPNDNMLLTGTLTERREAAERERLRRVAEREQSLAVLTSPDLDARRRIALWEQLHGLHLPADSKHALVNVIARRTALRVEEVRNEQQRRWAAKHQPSTLEPHA